MFTSPTALQIIGAPGRNISKPKLEDWSRVFVQSKYFGYRHLDRGTLVLYRVSES